jgi:hypothetical protein
MLSDVRRGGDGGEKKGANATKDLIPTGNEFHSSFAQPVRKVVHDSCIPVGCDA